MNSLPLACMRIFEFFFIIRIQSERLPVEWSEHKSTSGLNVINDITQISDSEKPKAKIPVQRSSEVIDYSFRQYSMNLICSANMKNVLKSCNSMTDQNEILFLSLGCEYTYLSMPITSHNLRA